MSELDQQGIFIIQVIFDIFMNNFSVTIKDPLFYGNDNIWHSLDKVHQRRRMKHKSPILVGFLKHVKV